MITSKLVLPGEEISTELLPTPSNTSIPLKLGPGLRHTPLASINPTIAGTLYIDHRKNAVWVENNSGRYIPQTSDLVIATVHHSSTDYYHCVVSPQTPFALLPQLAFEGATKKSRPQLVPGSLVYARVSSASKHLEPELVCYNPSTGKSEGMGELKDGMVFDISSGMARRLLMGRQREDGGLVVLEEIAEKVAFEVAVGRNGRIWVHSGSVKETLLVGRAVQETDRKGSGIEEQRKAVRRLLKEL